MMFDHHRENVRIFEDTKTIYGQGWYEVDGQKVELKLSQEQMQNCEVFVPKMIDQLCALNAEEYRWSSEVPTRFCCKDADSFEFVADQYPELLDPSVDKKPRVLVLDMANGTRIGGGVARGAKAQEEDLCRRSTLYAALSSDNAQAYYEYNRKNGTRMGTDAMIWVPQVEVFKDAQGKPLAQPFVVSVLVSAAPIMNDGLGDWAREDYKTIMYGRIMKILKMSAALEYRNLVLGAFGCGAFENDALLVSDMFAKACSKFEFNEMKLNDCFDEISFAVLTSKRHTLNYSAFARNFDNELLKIDRPKNAPNPAAAQMKDAPREATIVATMEELASKAEQSDLNVTVTPGKTVDCVFFWNANEPNGFLSNWYHAPFIIGDFQYFSVEQYMMSRKAVLCGDYVTNTKVLRANSSDECKKLGRQVTPFDNALWNAHRQGVVYDACRAKFEQHPELIDALLATGETLLAETNPGDAIWGIHMTREEAAKVDPDDWNGQNILGEILMDLRETFRDKKVDAIAEN